MPLATSRPQRGKFSRRCADFHEYLLAWTEGPMFGNRMRFVTMLGVAAGIPYVWFNETFRTTAQSGWHSISKATSYLSSSSSGSQATWPVSFGTSSETPRDPNAPAVGASIHQLADAVRFDVTPRWVTDRWERISTIRAERDLVGMRVPLVTGTKVEDFAGSLTYYFDANQHLRRLTLYGQTGDDRLVVEHATQKLGLRPEPHVGAGMYILRWNAKPMNVLRISHAPVIRAEEPYARYIVEMEVNDVRGGYGVSPEFAELLIPDQHVRRF